MRRRIVPFLIAAMLVAAADLASKRAVWSRLSSPFDRVVVIDDDDGDAIFEIVRHTNTGGMWGVGRAWNPWILRTFRLLAVGVVIVLLFQTPSGDRVSIVALGLVFGGALGNLYDSLLLHHVRDFLKFDFDVPVFDPFPTFNVADSAICVGVALLALRMFFTPAPDVRTEEASHTGAAER